MKDNAFNQAYLRWRLESPEVRRAFVATLKTAAQLAARLPPRLRELYTEELAKETEAAAAASTLANMHPAGQYTDWPTQVQVARRLGVSRATVHRLVANKRLCTNGQEGKACRIDPKSILNYCEKTKTAYNET